MKRRREGGGESYDRATIGNDIEDANKEIEYIEE